MAEVQKSSNTGEVAAQFIEFVMMQAQNASLFLGLTPNPSTGRAETNLDLARMFIDQLAMIQEKTRGNLSSEEANILRNVLSNLQMAFVEVSAQRGAPGAGGGRASAPSQPAPAGDAISGADTTVDTAAPSPREASPGAPGTATPPSAGSGPAQAVDAEERESKKRFTKSYGS